MGDSFTPKVEGRFNLDTFRTDLLGGLLLCFLAVRFLLFLLVSRDNIEILFLKCLVY